MRHAAIARPLALLAAMSAALATLPQAGQAQFREEVISCRVSETNLSLDMLIPLSRDGSGNAARGMRGTLDLHHQKISRDRRHWPLDDKLPAQFWNWGNEMKVRLLFGGRDQLIDLVIDTQLRAGTGSHNGQFRLETSEGVRVSGRIECQVG